MEIKVDFLLDTHIHMQMGCYFSGSKSYGNINYVWSDLITDTDWNFAYGNDIKKIDNKEAQWILEESKEHKSTPAIFIKNKNIENILKDLKGLSFSVNIELENWMVLNRDNIDENIGLIDDANITVKEEISEKPTPHFLEIFSNLFYDEEINSALKKYYVPALENSNKKINIQVIHFVLYDKEIPISCASVYIKDDIAGLYNVGTRNNKQKMGYGEIISKVAISHAYNKGCKNIFLQCQTNTHVENLYKNIGFRVVDVPNIVTLSKK